MVLTVHKLREVFYEAQACAMTQEVNKHYKYSYYYMSDMERMEASHLAAVTSYSIGNALFYKGRAF